MTKIKESQLTINEIYPNIATEQLDEVEANIRHYLTVVRHVFDHIQRDQPRILTNLRWRARLRKQKALG
jgi:hypothetical protein